MIITGTRKGIGRHLVDHYRAQGYVICGCSRQPVEESIEGYEHHCLDVADEQAVHQMITAVHKRHGRIDILLNNAGIASMNHVLLTPLRTVQSVFATNVFGTFVFAREAAKVMSTRRYGRIVNFATVATPLKLEGEAAYAASKAAVKSLTEVMAKELAPFNITVNAVGPTPVKTDLIKNVPKSKIDALIGMQAVKRLGEFRDITVATDFFIRRDCDFITGQTLYLGGVS